MRELQGAGGAAPKGGGGGGGGVSPSGAKRSPTAKPQKRPEALLSCCGHVGPLRLLRDGAERQECSEPAVEVGGKRYACRARRVELTHIHTKHKRAVLSTGTSAARA